MSPDPNALMTINASDRLSDALLNNQALQRENMRDASATLPAQATAIPSCFNTLITGPLHTRKPRRHSTSAVSLTG
jgi:hypothetical protein